MATIDIDKPTEAELTALNHRVVERLRFLQQMRAHVNMLDFSIGERVSFQTEDRSMVKGIVTKYNQKTVTVITESGQRWNVFPSFLRKTESSSVKGQVIDMPKK